MSENTVELKVKVDSDIYNQVKALCDESITTVETLVAETLRFCSVREHYEIMVKLFGMSLLKNVDIRTVDKSILKDMSDVKIDTSLPIPERVAAFLEQIKNPYVFKVGDVAVKFSYKENGPTLQENFENMINGL